MEIIKYGKENRVICSVCCTEYEFNADDIKLYDKHFYYVKCPVCGKKHEVSIYTSQRFGGSSDQHENEIVRSILNQYYLKNKEKIDYLNTDHDCRDLIMYANGEERY